MYKKDQIEEAMLTALDILCCEDCPMRDTFLEYTNMEALARYFNHIAELVRKYEVCCEVPTMVDFCSEELLPGKAVKLFEYPEIYAASEDFIETTFYKELWLLEDGRLVVITNYCMESNLCGSPFISKYRTVVTELTAHEDYQIPRHMLVGQLANHMQKCKNTQLPIYEI